ncbi:hypothetical protein OJ997_11195 [Solirubrobacter phytolaccae]|uniref:DUF4878 domain-containing protein n=1 Tax=Solirubrobacter phytolaccae TaxID=1404360 RepID=A0A9X3SB13_9ACTN|nr:hypothetical protein [Solirubrobacter phytolaccae]MDA0180860.1 hypothetical protein [Solirubrobacter phytolaccae]
MLKRWRTELIAFAVAIGLGVGVALVFGVGRTSEEDKVQDVAATYLAAFADNDPVALCNAISPVARVQFEFASSDCATSAKTAILKVPEQERAALREPSITVESVNDAEARVQFSPKLSGSGDMHLIKRNDTWFVSP